MKSKLSILKVGLSNSSNQQHWCDSKMWSVVQIHYEVFRRISESAGKFSAYVVYFGFLVILVAFIYTVRLIYMAKIGARPWQDTTTIIILLSFLGGVIILLLGVIGEYLARIYMEVKNRPIFIAKDKKLDL